MSILGIESPPRLENRTASVAEVQYDWYASIMVRSHYSTQVMRFDMNVRNGLRLSVLATLLLIASGAQGTVYRCAQAGGAVLYSDYPCDGASVVDIRPGSADPNAKERLAHAQAELDRAAAERRAREQFEAARREEMARGRQAARDAAEPPPTAPDTYLGHPYELNTPSM